MTYKEYYAGQALAGFCSITDTQPETQEAVVALHVANKMCELLEVNPDDEIYDALAEPFKKYGKKAPE